MSYHRAFSDDLNPVAVAKDVIGEEGARRLQQAFGGQKIYFPVRVGPQHPLAQALGYENALKLTAEIYRVHLYVPSGRTVGPRAGMGAGRAMRDAILWAALAGLKRSGTAALTSCSEAYVYLILSDGRKAGRLPQLPQRNLHV